MKQIIQSLLLGLLLSFSLPLIAEEIYIETGEIIESAGDNSYIQVRDKTLKVGAIFINNGDDVLVESNEVLLQMGDIVQCFIKDKEKEDEYWQAEKIVLLRGIAREKYLQESETVLIHDEKATTTVKKTTPSNINTTGSSATVKQKSETKRKTKIYFEDGVWKN